MWKLLNAAEATFYRMFSSKLTWCSVKLAGTSRQHHGSFACVPVHHFCDLHNVLCRIIYKQILIQLQVKYITSMPIWNHRDYILCLCTRLTVWHKTVIYNNLNCCDHYRTLCLHHMTSRKREWDSLQYLPCLWAFLLPTLCNLVTWHLIYLKPCHCIALYQSSY